MCGIIGFTGDGSAVSKLLNGLEALEYRGYDSSGIAYFDEGRLKCEKCVGRLSSLRGRLEGIREENISSGIGHTRWATHGEVSAANSHPHGNGRIYAVHNGIIENYAEIGSFLKECGYTFTSDTDTERAVLLADHFYMETGDRIEALRKTAEMIKGSFAFAFVFADIADTVFAMRRDSPLLVCPSDVGMFVASDISAALRYTKRYAVIEEGEIAILTPRGVTYRSLDGGSTSIEKIYETVTWDISSAEKGGYPHFMLKEINEESEAVARTLLPRFIDGKVCFEDVLLSEEKIKKARCIHISACGTAMHAALMGKHTIEKLARIPVNVEIASEFRYGATVMNKDDIMVIISQSGETADTLAALRLAKKRGIYTLAIVNVPDSTIAREADAVLFTLAGPEIAVASTKAYSVQIALLYQLAIYFADIRGMINEDEVRALCEALSDMPRIIRETMILRDECRTFAEKYSSAKSMFFIGRGQDYILSMEAALKMKEISYIHCEAYAAGELKHGTISLIEDGTPVIVYSTERVLSDKTVNNIREVRARGASVLLFTLEDFDIPDDCADDIVYLPASAELFCPLVSVVTAQLMAYYTAVKLGRDVDKPRNLAKSVTVE